MLFLQEKVLERWLISKNSWGEGIISALTFVELTSANWSAEDACTCAGDGRAGLLSYVSSLVEVER